MKRLSKNRTRQAGVAIGMAIGAGATVTIFIGAGGALGSTGVAVRLSTWVQCDLAASIGLAFSIARLARHRFFSPEDIDGALGQQSRKARVLQSVLQNTIEQFVLASIAYGAWLVPDNPSLPVAVAWWCVAAFALGRLLFFLGYERGAVARSLGFALTFYPTIGLIAVRLAISADGWLASR